jgi:DNA-binding MarR family transcriptional regulator
VDQVRWLSEEEERAWRALQFMQLRLEAELARQLAADSGLSYPDYLVLVALTDRPDGRMRLFQLGATLGWEKSRLSHHVARMADRGLVRKEKCDADRRGAYVVVTKRGRKEIEEAAPGHVAAVRQLFLDRLTPAQLQAVADAAEAVLAAFDEPPDPYGAFVTGRKNGRDQINQAAADTESRRNGQADPPPGLTSHPRQRPSRGRET